MYVHVNPVTGQADENGTVNTTIESVIQIDEQKDAMLFAYIQRLVGQYKGYVSKSVLIPSVLASIEAIVTDALENETGDKQIDDAPVCVYILGRTDSKNRTAVIMLPVIDIILPQRSRIVEVSVALSGIKYTGKGKSRVYIYPPDLKLKE